MRLINEIFDAFYKAIMSIDSITFFIGWIVVLFLIFLTLSQI